MLISIVTFPGVIVHELAHQLFCYLRRVPVYQVKYFQPQNPCGYVLHEATENPLNNFVISMGPFIVNTLLGAVILLPASIEFTVYGLLTEIRGGNVGFDIFLRSGLMLVSGWLGISVIMHAFPSTGDAKVLVANILKNKDVSMLTKVLVAPFVGFIYLGAIGSYFWLDLGYALLIAFLLPKLIGLFL